MKKTFKRAGVAVLSMAMLLSMGAMTAISSSAVGEAPITANSITVNISKTDGTEDTGAAVNVYKVAKVNDTGKWEWCNNVTPQITVGSYNPYVVFTAPTTGTVNQDYILLDSLTADQMKDLATALQTSASSFSTKQTGTASSTTLPTDGSAQTIGYYLVVTTPTDTSVTATPSLVSFNVTGSTSTTITAKTSNTIAFEKKITAVKSADGSATMSNAVSSSGDTALAGPGNKVEYSITTKLPTYATSVASTQDFVIDDDPSDGLTVDTSSIVVNVNSTDIYKNSAAVTGYSGYVTVTPISGDGFTVTIDDSFFTGSTNRANQGKDVVVTFSATINDRAVLGDAATVNTNHTNVDANYNTRTGNMNSAELTYSNNWSTGSGSTTLHDEVTTYVGSLDLNKRNNDDSQDLTGAEFSLKKSGVAVTNDKITGGSIVMTSGVFDFGYLEPGTYVLTETKAPVGYKTIDSTYSFTVTGKNTGNTSAEFDTYEYSEVDSVTNVTLTETAAGDDTITVNDPLVDYLPGTGGMGTVLFTVGGAAIVLLAGALFVVYMRRRKVEE